MTKHPKQQQPKPQTEPHSFEADSAWDDCVVCGQALMAPIHQRAAVS